MTLYEDKSPKFYTPYEYRVYAYTLDANSDFSNSAIIDVVGIDVNNNIIPTDYQLKQNYPNPFNPATKIAFSIPAASDVTLRLYDILGRSIKILIDEKLNAGEYEIKFKVKKLPSGIYFYSLNAKSVDGLKEFKDVKKLVIQK